MNSEWFLFLCVCEGMKTVVEFVKEESSFKIIFDSLLLYVFSDWLQVLLLTLTVGCLIF